MELLQLEYFYAVAKTQHVTHTAEQLHIAQPALTQSIHRLEKELGVPLFHRSGRNIALTEYGVYLRKICMSCRKYCRKWQMFGSVPFE